jgi:hypothetical protein
VKLKRLSLIMVLALGFLTFGTLFSANSSALLGLGQEAVPTRIPAPPYPDAYKVTAPEPPEAYVPGASPNHLTHPCGGMSAEPAFNGLSPLSLAYLPGTQGCSSGYGDIAAWQEGGQSYVGIARFGGAAFHIFNVTDPYNPTLVVTHPVGSGGSATLTIFSFKQGNSRYISTSTRGFGSGCGFFIYNIDNPAAPTLVSRTAGSDWCIVHEHFVSTDANGNADYAWLAMSGESGSGIKIVVLNLANLSAPVETGRYQRPDGVDFIHDSNVVGDRAYIAHWGGGMLVFDKQTLANNTNPAPLNPLNSIRPSNFWVHHTVPTTDGRFAFIEDEFLNQSNQEKIKYYNIENVASPVYVGGIIGPDTHSSTSQAHNMRILNVSPGHDILFVGWYLAGTRIFDVDTSGSSIVVTPRAMHQLRPTGGANFGGVWGVDFLPCTINGSPKTCVYSSDYQKFGVQIDALDYDPMLDPYAPESAVTSPTAGQEITTCTFTISGTAHDYYSGVSGVEVSTDNGATWQPATGTANWTYEWNIPADGSYTIQARSTDVAGNVQTIITPVSVTVNGSCSVLTPTPTDTATSVPTTAVPTTAVPTTAVPTTAVPTTPVPTVCTITFTDVPPGHTFYSAITCLACRGIISGYSDGTFRPNNLVTRGQLAKIVSNAEGFNEAVTGQTFQDVPPTHTFYEWVERLTTRGYMTGYNCGGVGEPCVNNRPYFRPFAEATRGQTSKIISNAAGYNDPIPADFQTFEDVPPSHTFWVWIERLYAHGPLITGYPCGGVGEPCITGKPYFRPGNNVTRGQAAKILARRLGCDTR